jgi:dynein heavy chain
VQTALNKSAKLVLKCSASLPDWGQKVVEPAKRRTFFARITKDIEIVKVILLLTGSIQGTKNSVSEYLAGFSKYDWLWKDEKGFAYRKFMASDPTLSDYERELMKFVEVEKDIDRITTLYNIGALSLNTRNLKMSLKHEASQWKVHFSQYLHQEARAKMSELNDYIRTTYISLNRSITGSNEGEGDEEDGASATAGVELDALRYVMNVLREVRERESGIEMEIVPVLDMYDMLEHFLPEGYMSQEEEDSRSVIRLKWQKLVDFAEDKTDELSEQQVDFRRRLLDNIGDFKADVLQLRKKFKSHGPMVEGLAPTEAVSRMKRFKEEFEIRDRKLELYCGGEELFALPQTQYPDMDQTRKELTLLDRLYGLYMDAIKAEEEWRFIPWEQVAPQIDSMTETVDGYWNRCRKMPKKLREWAAYDDLKIKLENFQTVLPLLQALSKKSIKTRHWGDVMKVTGTTFVVEGSEFKLGTLLDLGLADFKDDIEDITEGADKQLGIEIKLAEIKEAWAVADFEFMPWKTGRVVVLKGVVPVVEEIEEAQMQLQTMLTMRHVAPFREETQVKLAQLSDASETLELWLKVQLLWCSLESVFTGGDIAKQMPLEAKKFGKVDKDWVKNMAKAQETRYVVQCCSNELLKNTLPIMFAELQKCQKSLDGYLEQKRNKFPRFYFVSDPVLLLILSQGSDPLSMNQYYEKVFDSIDHVEHDRTDKTIIKKMFAGGGADAEVVPFVEDVKAVGNIEDWLAVLLLAMQTTMKSHCRKAAAECASTGGDGGQAASSQAASSLRGFVNGNIAQFALYGIQLMWTTDVQFALEQCKFKKNIMKETNAKSLQVLEDLSAWCLEDLGNANNRKKVETLVTIQVHQRDTLNSLMSLFKSKQINDAGDFEWLKQARTYWRPNSGDQLDKNGAAVIAITDVDFNYQFESLGSKERLVITPLTDRCYITLAQALGMYFGGAPAGPAGTGKTETVKDLGRTLGIYVVVTNCTDQQKYTDCAKIFKGLCQGGLWGCFDEFNRIQLPVLSVVAQQVLSIQNAKKTNVTSFTFPGEPSPIHLDPICGFFITMNPGYAGRQELPENLKALFRGVAMMVPNREIIMKVKLCSVGYHGFTALAKKFAVLYRTAEEQLSNQKHYDFGLRNILSVLRSAGQTKRDNIKDDEGALLFRTLRDMNLSKLVAQDVPLFLSLLQDLFPGVKGEGGPKVDEALRVDEGLQAAIVAHGLVSHPSWVSKVIQLYDTTLVRHGIMLVGPARGGKSAIFKCLQAALQAAKEIAHKQFRLNPKAIRAAEMYGEVDSASGEWSTGVFAAMWTKYNNRANSYNSWIIADGPVDAIWIEDLNTVLDDNKILTLANGDRIPMTDNVKLMFEVETLVNASPATVSRAGIIYVSETDLDWQPVVLAWLQTRPSAQGAALGKMFTKWMGLHKSRQVGSAVGVGHLFEFIDRNTSEVMKTSRVGRTLSMFAMLEGLIDGEDGYAKTHNFGGSNDVTASLDDTFDGEENRAEAASQQVVSSVELERLFVYSLAWTIGGLLDVEDRAKLGEYFTTIDGGEAASHVLPEVEEGGTVFDYFVDKSSGGWTKWKPDAWEYPVQAVKPKKGGAAMPAAEQTLDFSNLLVPTMDTARVMQLLQIGQKQKRPTIMVGDAGTAKTSTALMFLDQLSQETPSTDSGAPEQGAGQMSVMVKRVNFSSATTPGMFQATIEEGLDKRGGKSFGPPNGKSMVVFLDDLNMPHVNAWGDQPTLELVRLLVEYRGVCFLDKDKRGDFKSCEDLQYVAAMGKPGGGRNDIPNRLKGNFFVFNMVQPSQASIDDIYGQMLTGRFAPTTFDEPTIAVVGKLTTATIMLWNKMKAKMLPTPAKFHYVFNMRELSRVFQGVLLTPADTILHRGGHMVKAGLMKPVEAPSVVLGIWAHECERVFADKLTNHDDKDFYAQTMKKVLHDHFAELGEHCMAQPFHMVNFLRDDVYDEEGVFVSEAIKLYEPGGGTEEVRNRVQIFMDRHDEENPAKKMKLILFDDALAHLLRISRLLEMPRGSALLVGVGGSGKQSLTRLASYISRSTIFQIQLTKTYNQNSFMDDLRTLYRSAGHKQKQTTFLFTDAEIKDENFLELINCVLMTGEVAGLFAKDEMLAMTGDLSQAHKKARPGVPDTPSNMRKFFTDNVRDNLHVVLCMSPMNPKFAERARKFPGLINGPTIDWFLPWPEAALISVSSGFIKNHPMECTEQVKQDLQVHMGMVHENMTQVCADYYTKMRRNVCQTPKSYLSFLQNYKDMYTAKLGEIQEKEKRVILGLEKLVGGAADVELMKGELKEKKFALEVATQETTTMLKGLEKSSHAAKKESDQVATIKQQCEDDAERIAAEKVACEADLAKAQPFVDEAEEAIRSIKPAHIIEIKTNRNPSDIIKLVFDGVLLLFMNKLAPKVKQTKLTIAKQEVPFFEPSFQPFAAKMLGDAGFLKSIQAFGVNGKDKINDETIDFLCPYTDLEVFNPANAKASSAAAEGLCIWVRSMKFYHEASKIVKPKLEALTIAEGQLEAANLALKRSEERLVQCKEKLGELQKQFENQMSEKKRMEDNAAKLTSKMNMAESLIGGLAGEQVRWTEDANNFASLRRRLVGDCAVACAFVSYLGPFNQEYRAASIEDAFISDCEARRVPVTPHLDVTSFLVDVGTIGDWNMEGLPTDPLSIQNGILVTRSSRFPLLIDPQGQALNWIRNKEHDRLPYFGTTTLAAPKLKDQLEFCMAEGKSLVVTGVEEEVDPMLDPVLEKQIIVKARSKTIILADKPCDYDDAFMLFFITRLPNPNFSPELQAKTTVVDFTVTQKGLEEQLLGRVIANEQKALEEQLNQVLSDVVTNTKSLLMLDATLLERLTANTGNLLDDDRLIGVLNETKSKAKEVQEKLVAADETKRSINEKRELFRPVATRGSVLYFGVVEMSNANAMYQTSLHQFLQLFRRSMEEAERATLASKRVVNIIETMTYITYRYINRGLYEDDKLAFIMILAMKILVTMQLPAFPPHFVSLFLRGGAALDRAEVKKKPAPLSWLPIDAWLNVTELSQEVDFFVGLPMELSSNHETWRKWFDANTPERLPIPTYEARFQEMGDAASFYRLLIVRSLRLDRTILAAKQFIKNTPQFGARYIEPVTDTIESIYDEMVAEVPVIFLLSVGADPTAAIEQLARKKKQLAPVVVSLGEGQEPVAIRAVNAACTGHAGGGNSSGSGKSSGKDGSRGPGKSIGGSSGGAAGAGKELGVSSWVLLQNCELGLGLMNELETILGGLAPVMEANPAFRLFLTAMPTSDFPLGLLQISTKVTNEPPAGLQAGLLRSYTVMVDQDRLDRVESRQWRQLLFALCFLHSAVQERKKFGPLGWCIPYEFNTGDLTACIQFLEKHLYSMGDNISWPTLQYMVAEAQYGGKITDDLDRRLFSMYAGAWVSPAVCEEGFSYNPTEPIFAIPGGFNYANPATPTMFNPTPAPAAAEAAEASLDGEIVLPAVSVVPPAGATEIEDFQLYCSSLPVTDSPEIFGLHPNADLTYCVRAANSLINTMAMTQPKGGGSSGGVSVESAVSDKAAEVLAKLPAEFVEDDYRGRIKKMGGMSVPLNICLYQEIQRLNAVICKVCGDRMRPYATVCDQCCCHPPRYLPLIAPLIHRSSLPFPSFRFPVLRSCAYTLMYQPLIPPPCV